MSGAPGSESLVDLDAARLAQTAKLTPEGKSRVAEAAIAAQKEKARIADLKRASRGTVSGNLITIAVVALALIGIIVFALPALEPTWATAFQYLVVGGVSGLVGYGELVSRYQDSPGRLFSASSTPVYILVNLAAGVAALGIIQATGTLSDTTPPWLFQILLASFGAVAFFRTSLFTVRVGGTDVGIGPSALLQSLLGATDRMVDRDQAEGRAEDVASIMRLVDYNKARAGLPVLCLILVQNLTPGDQESLGRQIESLDSRTDIDDDSKSIILGVYLIRTVGPDVLERSVSALGSQILKDAKA